MLGRVNILAVVAEVRAGMGATCTAAIFALGQGRPCPCLDESPDGGQLLDTPCSGLNFRRASSATCKADF